MYNLSSIDKKVALNSVFLQYFIKRIRVLTFVGALATNSTCSGARAAEQYSFSQFGKDSTSL